MYIYIYMRGWGTLLWLKINSQIWTAKGSVVLVMVKKGGGRYRVEWLYAADKVRERGGQPLRVWIVGRFRRHRRRRRRVGRLA